MVLLSNAPLSLDPRVATDAASSQAFQLLFNGLVTKDPHGNLIPDLAESWEVLDGGRRYRFHLHPEVRFHDGRPLRAEDVAWTYGSIVRGEVATSKKGAFARVEEVLAVDPLTVDFRLSEPFGSFLVELTPEQGVIPAGATAQEMSLHPVGTGPFRFVERTPETVTLEAFAEHWRGRPYLDRVILKEVPDSTVRALELMKGSAQLLVDELAPDLVPRFRRDPAYRVVVSPSGRHAYLGLNLEDPILAQKKVRRALAMALDRQRLLDTLWQGLGRVTETLLPPGLWAHHDGLVPIAYDPEAAKRLLDEAGYPDPEGPEPRFHLTYKTSTNESYVLQAQILQRMLEEVGVDVEIRSFEFATLYADITRGNFQIFSLVWTGVIDPNIYQVALHSESVPPAGRNRGRYRNPRFDRLVDEAARLTDPEERRPLYWEIQEILARDLPYVSLYNPDTVAVMPAQLEGWVSYPNGELLSLREVRWIR